MSTVKQGSKGPQVRAVQTRLHELGLLTDAPDGIFGPRTAAAVRAFQQQQGLGVDGIVGPQTRAALGLAAGGSGGGSSGSGGGSSPASTGRAPGLPDWVRDAGPRRGAFDDVTRRAESAHLGATFVRVCQQMALTESGATYGLPAHTFNNLPPDQRPPGKGLITAWGVFQYNRDAWTGRVPGAERRAKRSWVPRGSAGCEAADGCVYPWDVTEHEEIAIPIEHFARTFREIRDAGGDDEAAAMGIRIRHKSPGVAYRQYLDVGRERGFEAAFAGLDQKMQASIRRFVEQMNSL
ncbi:peptidoglycan-binding protein [Actinotalea sp. K2]|uniref:peptidoglycan-binding domain-containing protein n=1 Tax=Actinotalea sp. K2 TaxID=2939438 RepID=UPI0020178F6F|nr:peptidoglycan-binding protein [Actinotalea sp. K2]MCL3861586.1 peptidoglycan-binding protein [Actinotalea sp. K2]